MRMIMAGMAALGLVLAGPALAKNGPQNDRGIEKRTDIVDIAIASDDFDTLEAAVIEAGLVDALSANGPLTVLAPNDDAFETFLADNNLTAEDLLADPDLGLILAYHVIPGNYTRGRILDLLRLDDDMSIEVDTLNGDTVTLSFDNGKVFADDAEIIATNIQAANGIIHVLNNVLSPGS